MASPVRSDALPMQIFVKTLSDNVLPLSALAADTIVQVKAKIQEKEGTLIEQQRLIYAGVLLLSLIHI
eukprot:8486582-Karenia_brevis.AAC.1